MGVVRVKGARLVNIGNLSTAGLRLGQELESQRGLARGGEPQEFAYLALGQATDAQSPIEGGEAGRDVRDFGCGSSPSPAQGFWPPPPLDG